MRKFIPLLLALISVPAVAQNVPQTLPANTVVGRLGLGPGPAQAIPFATLVTALGGLTSTISIGNTPITGGTTTRVLYDNAGRVGEYTNTQLTALINLATASLPGTVPAFPGNTTTFFRGDGTFAAPLCASLSDSAAFCAGTDATNLTGTVASARLAGAYTGITGLAAVTMTGVLTLNADPASALQAATKQYVDAVATGLQIKTSAAVATTANITLSGEQTIDGVLTSASRILVKNQTAPAENGVYTTGAGAWTRTTDIDVWSEVVGAFVLVTGGGQAGTGWSTQVAAGGTINVTAMPWAQFSANTQYTAGTGLTLVGSQFSIAGRTGNTTTFATATGTLTSGRCAQWDASGNLVQAAAACGGTGTVTSIIAGAGLSGGTITTTGTISLNLANANTWTAAQNFSAAAYFGGGRPWADVGSAACGPAVGNGVGGATATVNTNAFDACVTIISGLGGGDVFVPPGTYCVKPNSGSFALNYTGINNLRLICAGPQGACAINACVGDGTTFTVIRLNGQKNALVNMTVNGPDPAAGVAPTGNGVLFDTGCTECYAENSKFLRGQHAVVASAADIWFKDVNMDASYGSSLLNVNGAIHMMRGKLDQAWPTTEWTVGATIPAWAASTVYATNAFASRLGFIFQATTGGTSAGSGGPVVTTYGTGITDNTVTWKLVAPASYACLEFSGGGASWLYDVDCTGPYLYGVALTSGSPQSINLDGFTFGGPRQACIYLNSGSQFSVQNSQLARCGLGLQTDSGWTSEVHINNNRIYQNLNNGVQLGKPLLSNVNNNTFSGNSGWGIAIAGQANIYVNVNSNLFISNGSGAVDFTSGSTQCSVAYNSSNGQTYTIPGCLGVGTNN